MNSAELTQMHLVIRLVKVSNRSGAGNYHFRDLQTVANDVRKAEKTYFSTGNAIQSHY